MKIYGVTLIDTDSIDGWTAKESYTWLFKTEEEQLEKAWEVYSNGFQNNFPDGEDYEGNTLPEKDDFTKEMAVDGYAFYVRGDSHCQVKTFEQELQKGALNMKNYIFSSFANPDIAFVLGFEDEVAAEGKALALEGFQAWCFGEETEHYSQDIAEAIYDSWGYMEASEDLLDKANIPYTVYDWLDEAGDLLPEHENEDYEVVYPQEGAIMYELYICEIGNDDDELLYSGNDFMEVDQLINDYEDEVITDTDKYFLLNNITIYSYRDFEDKVALIEEFQEGANMNAHTDEEMKELLEDLELEMFSVG